MSPHRVRAFVAIDLPERHRRRLAAHLEECARLAPAYRWVPPENLHLTLRFLGWLEPAVLAQLRSELASVRIERFRIALDGQGTFGPSRAPRVVWLGLGEGADRCGSVAEAVETVCRAAGLEPEPRPFHAHLTLARARPETRRLPDLPPPPVLEPWTVAEFILYESRLGGRTPVYAELERYALRSE